MRIIDADALRATVMKILNNSIGGAYDGVYQCLEAINNAPTVCNDNYSMGYRDGVRKVLSERPQGHWIVDEEHSITMTLYKCTNCDYFGGALHYNYCPHCGADMRKETNND